MAHRAVPAYALLVFMSHRLPAALRSGFLWVGQRGYVLMLLTRYYLNYETFHLCFAT